MSKTTVFLLVSLVGILAGCNPGEPGGSGSAGLSAAPVAPGSGSPAPDPPPPPGVPAPRNSSPTRIDDSMFLARAAYVAEREGRVTLNTPWSTQDSAGNEIDHVDWKPTLPHYRWQGTTYTTLVSQYRERRKQCEIDSQVTYAQRYPEGGWGTGSTDNPNFPICHPTLEDLTPNSPIRGTCAAVLQAARDPDWAPGPRYGYWCGAGHPPLGVGNALAPEPLDAVDFCCMLHDAQRWGSGGDFLGTNGETERGMAMCLYMATQYPAGSIDKLPDVEESRQFWYGCAALASDGNQFNEAPPPVVRR